MSAYWVISSRLDGMLVIEPIDEADLYDMSGESPIDDGRCPCGFDVQHCTPHGTDCLYGAAP